MFFPDSFHSSVNKVVPHHELLSTAIEWAREITKNSPDAVTATKRSLLLSRQFGNVEEATVAAGTSRESRRTYEGDNIKVRAAYPQVSSTLKAANLILFYFSRKAYGRFPR